MRIIFRILSGSSKEIRCLIGSYCRPTSVVSWLTDVLLKIRLFGLSTPWSGDIPLEAAMGKRKSFMVKLPLRDKLGSTTIWCTILTEELAGHVSQNFCTQSVVEIRIICSRSGNSSSLVQCT